MQKGYQTSLANAEAARIEAEKLKPLKDEQVIIEYI